MPTRPSKSRSNLSSVSVLADNLRSLSDNSFTSVHSPSSPERSSSVLTNAAEQSGCAVHNLLDPSKLTKSPLLAQWEGLEMSDDFSKSPVTIPASETMSSHSDNIETSTGIETKSAHSVAPRLATSTTSPSLRNTGKGNGETFPQSPAVTPGLVETAVSVRELSRRIGRAKVKWQRCKRAILITKMQDHTLVEKCREVALWLINTPRYNEKLGLTVYVDSKFAKSKRFDYEGIVKEFPHCREKLLFWTPEMCATKPAQFDFIITLGGDGTVLYTSWLFQSIVPAVVPFHMGSLGFLTCFDYPEYKSLLDEVLQKGVRVNLRMRFSCTIYRARLKDSATIIVPKDGVDTEQCGLQCPQLMANPDDPKTKPEGMPSTIIVPRSPEISCQPQLGNRHWVRSDITHGNQQVYVCDTRYHHCFQDPYLQSSDVDSDTSDIEINSQQSGVALDSERFDLEKEETFQILNEVSVDRGPSPYMSILELFADRQHLTTVQADGLTIATPTGSTAYSLAAGGSLVHPEIPAILITPNCPHTLSFRPMLLPDSTELIIMVPTGSRNTVWASFDGRHRTELCQGDHIRIVASKYPFPTICSPTNTPSTDWFQSLTRCLHWNQRSHQKPFS
ncbi:hypothetical protein IWQ62_002915 [Dispira parvispora]|uniref:NAD(+) kinase n=1 Tax=Dispira parvispora TaxID=1520584 RepID=A0A9W8AST9_9FUNG|nr:hypothetical protein IWQ62_002915 [Dispira parvispora]